MILSAYTKGTKEMASAMNKMIDLKYVPCGIHTLCRLLASATNGDQPVLDTDWIATGGDRPPIASLDEIKLLPIAWKANLDVFGLIPTSHVLYLIIT